MLEAELREARLGDVENGNTIFDALTGREDDYDEQLWDTLNEVRLARLGWSRGFTSQKMIRPPNGPSIAQTPDFLFVDDARRILAEAKRFRFHDYPLDFARDRMLGLEIVHGGLDNFGVNISPGPTYGAKLETLKVSGPAWRNTIRDDIRRELNDRALPALLTAVKAGEERRLVDGLLVVTRSELPGHVGWALSEAFPIQNTGRLLLDKLGREALKKSAQINAAVDNYQANGGLVFLSGIDDWDIAWSSVWEALRASQDPGSWPWSQIREIRKNIEWRSSIPITVVVGRGSPVVYEDLQWEPSPRRGIDAA